MLRAILPRVFATARVAVAPRVFVVAPRILTLTSRSFAFSARSFAAAATATKKTTAARSDGKRSSETRKSSGTTRAKAAPKGRKKKTTAKKSQGRVGRPKRKGPKPEPKKTEPVLPVPPRRPTTPFLRFLAEERASKPSSFKSNVLEFAREAGATWKTLSDAQKQKYSDAFNEGLKEYHRQLEQWASGVSYPTLRAINRRRLQKKKRKITLPGHTEFVKPTNPFIVFLADQRALSEEWEGAPEGGLPRQQWFVSKTAANWRALPDAQKQVYKDRAAKHNTAYHAQAGSDAQASSN